MFALAGYGNNYFINVQKNLPSNPRNLKGLANHAGAHETFQ